MRVTSSTGGDGSQWVSERNMSLQKIFCPSCKQSFFASDRIGALVVCANCQQSLEVTADSVRVCQPATPESAVQNFQKKSTLPVAKRFLAPRKPAPSPPANSVTQQISPPELETKSPSSRLSFGTDQLQTAVWKFILPVGLAFVFVATVTALASQGLKRTSERIERITFRIPSPVGQQSRFGNKAKPPYGREKTPPTKSSGSGDPIQAAMQSVAVVSSVKGGWGSGFVVDKNILVTNRHVVVGINPSDIRIRFPDSPLLTDKVLTANLIFIDPVNDLAALSFEADVPPLVVNKNYQYQKGRPVTVIGSPMISYQSDKKLENLASSGRLGPPAGDNLWSTSIDTNPGNSGGPVLDDETGEVVAVHCANYKDTDSQALAVPHPILLKVIESAQNADSEDIRQALIELRIRNCFHELCSVLAVEGIVCRKSADAFWDDSKETLAGRVSAFNNCKSQYSGILSKNRAKLDTQLAAEINFLEGRVSQPLAVTKGLKSLFEDVGRLADKLRQSLTTSATFDCLNEYDSSLGDARSLAHELAGLLHTRVSN